MSACARTPERLDLSNCHGQLYACHVQVIAPERYLFHSYLVSIVRFFGPLNTGAAYPLAVVGEADLALRSGAVGRGACSDRRVACRVQGYVSYRSRLWQVL